VVVGRSQRWVPPQSWLVPPAAAQKEERGEGRGWAVGSGGGEQGRCMALHGGRVLAGATTQCPSLPVHVHTHAVHTSTHGQGQRQGRRAGRRAPWR
jgi:hypothetical protein